MNLSRIRNAKVLVTLGAVSLALIAASPASAQGKNYDSTGKEMCKRTVSNGDTYWYKQGETAATTQEDGTKVTEKCTEGGKWVVVKIESPHTGTLAVSTGTSGTLSVASSGGTDPYSGIAATTGSSLASR
jgi:hypothetical protein